VTIAPSTDLIDGSTVTVAVTGFGVTQKIHVSECASVEDANEVGCGHNLRLRPFS
jgi:hypothetical protein